MYEDILKFLKSKNKKLTKEEANEFIRLLAESVGYDEVPISYSSVDCYDDEVSTEFNFVIDNFNIDSCSEDDSFSLEGISDEDEEDKEYVVLNKRKIKRNIDFKRKKLDEIQDEKFEKEIDNTFLEIDTACTEKNEDLIHENESETKEFIPLKNIISVPKNLDTSNCSIEVPENSEKTFFTLPKNIINPPTEFKLPQMDVNNKFEFKLPKFECQSENEEFKFELGDLVDVNNNGPDYKFFDEDKNEL